MFPKLFFYAKVCYDPQNNGIRCPQKMIYFSQRTPQSGRGGIAMLKQRGFYKGIDLGGWFSQCDYSEERLDTFITEEDIAKIASWGADHVRLPFDYNVVQEADGTMKEDGLARIDRALALCQKHGLHVVLDLHKTAGFSFDSGEREEGFFESAALQERFCQLWEVLADRYGHMHEAVAFELLNEITDAAYLDVWNKLVPVCMERLRKYAPETLVLVGSYWNNSPAALKDLDAPYDDKVAYNIHCYEPLKFTHQGAYWTAAIDPAERMSFAESGVTPAYFEKLFASAMEKAARHGAALYCGEYGVIDRVSPEDTLAWYRAIHTAFETCGIGRCAWSYKEMDFGISDKRLDGVRDELLKNL